MGMDEKRISLFGNFGSLNLGNECTLQAIIHHIRRLSPGADIECICTNPEDVSSRHGVPAIPMSRRLAGTLPEGSRKHRKPLVWRLARLLFVRFPWEIVDWARAIRTLTGRGMLVMTGTGMLTDCTEGPFGLPYQIFKWAVSAKLCRLQLSFVSVGVEPVRLRLTTFFINTSLRLADYVSFRDRHSRDYMQTMGYHGMGFIFPDLAFSLPEKILPGLKAETSPRDIVGVGLFDYVGRGGGGIAQERLYRDYVEKLSAFVAWLVGRGHPVRVLIGDIRYDNPVRDDFRASLAAKGIQYGECNITDEPVFSVRNLLDQIVATDMVVATRYHNIVLALMLQKPVISISYERKNDALMAALGLSDYCQRIDRFDVQRLTEQFAQLEKNAAGVTTQIQRKTTEYRNALGEQFATLFAPHAPARGTAHPFIDRK